MTRRIIKVLLGTILLVLLVVGMLLVTVLYTQTGSRWAINLALGDEVSVQGIEGTLGSELNIQNIQLQVNGWHIDVLGFRYQLEDIRWFYQGISLVQVEMKSVHIKQPVVTGEPTDTDQFDGFDLPVAVEIAELNIKELVFIDPEWSEKVTNIATSIQARKGQIFIEDLVVNHPNLSLQATGSLGLGSELPVNMHAHWELKTNTNHVSGDGRLTGDMNQLSIDQEIELQHQQLHAPLTVRSNVNLEEQWLEITVNSDAFNINLSDHGQSELTDVQLKLDGWVNDYSSNGQFNWHANQIESALIKFQANGNKTGIDIHSLSAHWGDSSLQVPSELTWDAGAIRIISQLQLIDFNPDMLIAGWSGQINGQGQISANLSEMTEVVLSDLMLEGSLKEQPFSLNTAGQQMGQTWQITPSTFTLGHNKVSFEGALSENDVDVNFRFDLEDLSGLSSDLNGGISGQLDLSGPIRAVSLKSHIQGDHLRYFDHQVNDIDIKAEGMWPNDIKIIGSTGLIKTGQQQFNQFTFSVNGTTTQHRLQGRLSGDDVSSAWKVMGGWDTVSKQWLGNIQEHWFEWHTIDQRWELSEPAQLELGLYNALSESCWYTADNDSFCLSATSYPSDSQHLAKITMNQMNIGLFSPWLPPDLRVSGHLQGHANLKVQSSTIRLESDIQLNNGMLLYAENSDNPYITDITGAQLLATHEGDSSSIEANVTLADGSFLLSKANVNVNQQGEIELNSTLAGTMQKSRYLASLIPQVATIQGSLELEGNTKGAVTKPQIDLTIHQPDGHLTLAQTGTRIENNRFKLSRQGSSPADFSYQGKSGDGELNISGQLDWGKANGWQINAHASGRQFPLLNRPEISLTVSPEVTIQADAEQANITGKMNINQGRVEIKQLPEAAIESSPDVVVHRSKETEVDTPYQTYFNIQTQIDDVMKIDALGLVTDLSGGLRVSNHNANSSVNGYGQLSLNNGTYKIYGQSLQINQGNLMFNGPIDNPTLDVVASRLSIDQSVTAGVSFGGTVNNLETSLYSDPTLSDLEILSYILTGRGLNEDNDVNSEQLAQAALLLGLKRGSPVFNEIQNKLGIDVLAIKEGATQSESLIEAGKQINDKLYLGYNHGIFNRLGFWVLRYQINQALKLESTQGENQSVDLIYQRKKK